MLGKFFGQLRSIPGFWLAIVSTLLAVAALYFTWKVLQPAPPDHVVIAAGVPGGEYDRFARQYAKYFADNGFELEVRPTAGSVENYALLLDERSGVDVAMVQGGTAPVDASGKLEAVCSIYYEPLWVFYRGNREDRPITRLSELAGKRVAIGPMGSGVRALAGSLLAANGINSENPGQTQLSDLGAQEAAQALVDGKLDAAVFVTAPESAIVTQLIRAPGIQLMNFDQADAYARRFGYLSRVTLSRGMLDLGADIPERDIQLIAPAATLVSRKGTHQGITELLVRAARAAHSGNTSLSEPGQFPSTRLADLPVSRDAEYYLRTPPSRLLGGLPFWLKSLIDRLLLLIIPLIALLLPLMRFAPALFRWSVRSRITRYYTRLRNVDEHLENNASREVLQEDLHALESLSHKLAVMAVPAGYMPDLFDLRLNLDRQLRHLRMRLMKLRDESSRKVTV